MQFGLREGHFFSSPFFFRPAGFHSGFPLVRGAKVSRFFVSGKLFGKKILSPFPFFPASPNLKNFAVIAGAKVHPFSSSASIPAKFFRIFFRFYLKMLEAWGLRREVFFGVSCRKGNSASVSAVRAWKLRFRMMARFTI